MPKATGTISGPTTSDTRAPHVSASSSQPFAPTAQFAVVCCAVAGTARLTAAVAPIVAAPSTAAAARRRQARTGRHASTHAVAAQAPTVVTYPTRGIPGSARPWVR